MDAPFHVLQGTFVVVGHAPDGDSIRFVADDASQWSALPGHTRLRFGHDGAAQVRLEGIDAPELHYHLDAQPLGVAARDALLAELGFEGVEYVDLFATRGRPVRGAMAARSIDVRGRVIGYLFRRTALSGRARLSVSDVRESVNAAMLQRGMAYPLAYDTQEARHRRLFASFAASARTARRGVWAIDCTAKFPLVTARSLGANGALVYPKLFRRCIEYLDDRTRTSRMQTWLAKSAGGDNDVVLVDRHLTRLSAFIRERDGIVRTSLDPLRVVFVAR